MSVRLAQTGRLQAISLGLLVAVFAVGCNGPAAEKKPSADAARSESHDHGDHAQHAGEEHAQPKTFAEGVSLLKEHYVEIKQAFDQTDTEKAVELAHEPMHGIGDILEALPELAKQANLTPEDLQTVKQSVDAMMECYGSVDGAVHDGKEPGYKDVAAKIDEALAALEAVQAPAEK